MSGSPGAANTSVPQYSPAHPRRRSHDVIATSPAAASVVRANQRAQRGARTDGIVPNILSPA